MFISVLAVMSCASAVKLDGIAALHNSRKHETPSSFNSFTGYNYPLPSKPWSSQYLPPSVPAPSSSFDTFVHSTTPVTIISTPSESYKPQILNTELFEPIQQSKTPIHPTSIQNNFIPSAPVYAIAQPNQIQNNVHESFDVPAWNSFTQEFKYLPPQGNQDHIAEYKTANSVQSVEQSKLPVHSTSSSSFQSDFISSAPVHAQPNQIQNNAYELPKFNSFDAPVWKPEEFKYLPPQVNHNHIDDYTTANPVQLSQNFDHSIQHIPLFHQASEQPKTISTPKQKQHFNRSNPVQIKIIKITRDVENTEHDSDWNEIKKHL